MYCQGQGKKVLHERVLDLTAAVVFPGSRSPHPLISNRTKNVSLAPIVMMMVAMIMTNNDNDDDNYKQTVSIAL